MATRVGRGKIQLTAVGCADYFEEIRCVLADMMSVIHECQATDVVVGGDFNFNFKLDAKVSHLFGAATGNNLISCM